MNANVVRPGEGRLIMLGPIQMRVLEDGRRTSGALGIAEFVVPPAHLAMTSGTRGSSISGR